MPAYGSVGALGSGTGSCAPGMPAGVSLGGQLVMFVGSKYPPNGPATPTTPSGAIWTAPTNNQAVGGAGSAGVDTGNVNETVYTKIADAADVTLSGTLGTITVTVGSGNSCSARIHYIPKTSALVTFDVSCAIGSDNSGPDTTISMTGGSNLALSAGDLLLVGTCHDTDKGTSGQTISATGCTFGVLSEKHDDNVTAGDDHNICTTVWSVFSGPSTAAPVYSGTLGGNGAGCCVFVRVRELGGTDGPNGWKTPASGADFEAAGELAFSQVWPCQDTAFNIISTAWPHASSQALTLAGSTSTLGLYQQAVSGWTRKAIGSADGNNVTWRRTDFSLGTTDTAMAAIVKMVSLPAAQRPIMALAEASDGSAGVRLLLNSNGTLTLDCNGVIATGSYNYVDSAEHFFWLGFDRTNALVAVQTDKELISGTYDASIISQGGLGLGYVQGTATATAEVRFLWAGATTGAGARRNARTFLQNMGVTVSQALSGTSSGVASGSGVAGSGMAGTASGTAGGSAVAGSGMAGTASGVATGSARAGAGLSGTASGIASGVATLIDEVLAYEDYVGVLDSAGFDYRGEVSEETGSYRGACDAGVEYVGVLDSAGFDYRGSVEPPSEEVHVFSMIVGNRSPSLERVLKNAETNAVIDLTLATGVTVEFRIGTTGTLKTGTAVIVTAAAGLVRYDWAVDDIDNAGTCYLRFIATFPTAKKQTVPSDGSWFEFPVSD